MGDQFRRPINPQRDAELTAAFHRMLAELKPAPKPVDGIPIPKAIREWPGGFAAWPGWPIVRVDTRFLK